jgi:tRNA (mo5U34)-methyltransferase
MAGDPIAIALVELGLADAHASVVDAARSALRRQGDLARGLERLAPLAPCVATRVDLDLDTPTSELSRASESIELEEILHGLGPWKKGPFRLLSPERPALTIDAEWRSDLKWRRVLELGATFRGKRVLDVGTGNGYFLFRLQGAGASDVVGLEPGLRSLLQFMALSPLFPAPGRSLWPLRLEELPPGGEEYDTVMSMGVLYHQRDAVLHLRQLRERVAPGGELILETITVPGTDPLRIAPGARYAGMRNVHVVPNEGTLLLWLHEAGFSVEALGKAVLSTSAEQRRTVWAPGPSLEDALEAGAGPSDDPQRPTCEGHPRPARVALRAMARRATA